MAETLGDRLKTAMKAKGASNSQVAKAARVHPVTVSQWRGDKQEPADDALVRIAKVLDVSAAWLRYGGTVVTPEPAALQLHGHAPTVRVSEGYPGRLSPAVYAALHGYLEELDQRGLDAGEGERLLAAFARSPLFPAATDEQQIHRLAIQWDAITRALLPPTARRQAPTREIPEKGADPDAPASRAGLGGSTAPTSDRPPKRRRPKGKP